MTLNADPADSSTFVYRIGSGSDTEYTGPFSVEYNQTVSVTATPTTGYAFTKWENDSKNATRSTSISKTTTWTATSALIPCTVTFDSSGGSSVEDQTVSYGHTATEPAAPTKGTCRFDGWYSGSTLFDFSTPITDNITLKACWTYFDGNGNEYKVIDGILYATKGNGSGVMADFGNTSNIVDTLGITENFTSASMDDTMTAIGDYAFSELSSLTGISMPSVTSIGESAFCACVDLVLSSLPSGITSIGDGAFEDCEKVTFTSLPSGITSISDAAFCGCTGLALSSLSDGITSIGEVAFADCTNITFTSLPSGITSIANSAFSGCTGLALTSLPSGVTEIGYFAFDGCTGITQLVLPDDLTSIGDYAFQNCTGLKRITLPNGLTTVGVSAFQGCSSLTSLTTPKTITSIGANAFALGSSPMITMCYVYGYTNGGLDAYKDLYTMFYYRYIVTLEADPADSATFRYSTESVTDAEYTQPFVVGYNEAVSVTVTPAEGHMFTKWEDDSTLVTRLSLISETVTMTATTALIPYTITFDGNGNTGGTAPADIDATYGSSYEAPANSWIRTGHTFVKWNTEADGSGTDYTVGATLKDMTTTAYDVITLYAIWSANTYTVTFDKNEGDSVSPSAISVTYGQAYGALATASRIGYTLSGWFTSPSGGNEITSDSEVTAAADHVLYAHWTVNQYTISFNSNGGSAVSPITQDYNSAVTAPANPTKTKYEFVKWQLNGKDYTFSTMPAENITLDAVWLIVMSADDVITEGDTKKIGTTDTAAKLNKDAVNALKNGSKNVQIDTRDVSIGMSTDSFGKLAGPNDMTVSAEKSVGVTNAKALEKLSEAKKKIAAAATVLDICVETDGTTSGLGTIRIAAAYTLADGQSADKIAVYGISDDGEFTKMNFTYADGKIMIDSSCFSTFAVCSEELTENSGGVSGGVVILIAVGVILIVGLAVLFARKH